MPETLVLAQELEQGLQAQAWVPVQAVWGQALVQARWVEVQWGLPQEGGMAEQLQGCRVACWE